MAARSRPRGWRASLDPLGRDSQRVDRDDRSSWLHVGVILGFLLIVLHSKHLHIFLAPINVGSRAGPTRSARCCRCTPTASKIDFEDPPDDAVFGRGRIEDFTWKGLLDMRDLHRVRSLPVAVPRVEHREAAVAQAHDHEPARPRLREGAVHAGRQKANAASTPSSARSTRRSWPRSARRSAPRSSRPLVGARESTSTARPTATTPAATAITSAPSSTPTPCGPARPAAPASTSAPSTSSTSTTSSTCAATRS